MSYSLGQAGTYEEMYNKLLEARDQNYPEDTAAPGVREQIGLSAEFVEEFLQGVDDDGKFSVSLSGHVKQGENDRTSLSVSISPIT